MQHFTLKLWLKSETNLNFDQKEKGGERWRGRGEGIGEDRNIKQRPIPLS